MNSVPSAYFSKLLVLRRPFYKHQDFFKTLAIPFRTPEKKDESLEDRKPQQEPAASVKPLR